MNTFIICHKDLPLFNVPHKAKVVWLNAKMPDNPKNYDIIPGYDYIRDAEINHNKLSGAIGPMIIHKIIESMTSGNEKITIWQYRKFVSRQKFGKSSKNYVGTNVLFSEEAEKLNLYSNNYNDYEFTVSAPLQIGNLSKQYLTYHHISDLLKYTALAVDLNVISEEDSYLFLNCAHLIIGGLELGTYPLYWWKEKFNDLQKVSLEFIRKCIPANPNDPYQKRAVAFCQERLGSFILLKKMSSQYQGNLPIALFGTIHTVSDTGTYNRGI